MEDHIVIHCKGWCRNFQTIPCSQIAKKLEESGYTCLDKYRDYYVCLECEARFVVMIGEIPCPNPARDA
jgi:hypothetical protein